VVDDELSMLELLDDELDDELSDLCETVSSSER